MELAAAYLNGADPRAPLVSPIHADLRGLPPVLIQVGSAETLLDDAVVLAVGPPGPGLELDKITPARTADGLVIQGDITNTGSIARDVPRLRVALRDPDDKETQFKIIDPPKARLGPGETAHFRTSFDSPDETATVKVSFAPR